MRPAAITGTVGLVTGLTAGVLLVPVDVAWPAADWVAVGGWFGEESTLAPVRLLVASLVAVFVVGTVVSGCVCLVDAGRCWFDSDGWGDKLIYSGLFLGVALLLVAGGFVSRSLILLLFTASP